MNKFNPNRTRRYSPPTVTYGAKGSTSKSEKDDSDQDRKPTASKGGA